MNLIECCGLPQRPCEAVLGYQIVADKDNGITHGLCRACYLETQLENGVATHEEKLEIHAILQHHKMVALRGYRQRERRENGGNGQ